MATINPKKIDSITPMLRQYFSGNDPVAKEFLWAKVEEDIILIAVEEGFIRFESGVYGITQKGRAYRDR